MVILNSTVDVNPRNVAVFPFPSSRRRQDRALTVEEIVSLYRAAQADFTKLLTSGPLDIIDNPEIAKRLTGLLAEQRSSRRLSTQVPHRMNED